MPNEFYDHTGFPQTNTRASSALMRAELDAVEQGFDKLPVLAGNGSEIVTVKADATGLESKTQVELHLVRDDGDVYTGTHDFTGATITAPTQSTADSSTKVATTAFVNNVAMNPALPNQTGNAGKFVTTDGTNASWAATFSTMEILTSGTSWTCPAGVTRIKIRCVGGGGGGSGGHNSPAVNGYPGAGGGYCERWETVVPGNSYTYAIGAAGSGGGPNVSGGSGGATQWTNGTTITAGGGGGGTLTLPNAISATTTCPGGIARLSVVAFVYYGNSNGVGGSNPLGTGGVMYYNTGSTTTLQSPSGYGAGGGSYSSTVQSTGQSGTAGVIILEY